MASHKKTPIFLRVITNENSVVCINPSQVFSFQIRAKAKIKTKDDQGKDTTIEADTIRFYSGSGMGVDYSVGVDITQAEFDYACATLTEYVYLNEGEFKAKTAAIRQTEMDEWNALSEANSAKLADETQAPAA